MKKTILALCMAGALFACKKETNSDSTGSSGSLSSTVKVPVKFNVQDFLVSQQEISANGRVETDTSLKRFAYIDYVAYKSDGAYVNFIKQDTVANKTNFGIISDSLAPGTYTIILAASTQSIHLSGVPGNTLNNCGMGPQNLDNQTVGDLFFKKLQVTISENGNPAIIDVSLNRVAGMLRLDLKDALPSTAPYSGVDIYVYYQPANFSFATESPTYTSSMQFVPTRISQTIWEDYLIGSSNAIRVLIAYKDKSTGATLGKTLDNIQVNANKKTIISGYLYGVPQNIGGGDYTLKFNQDWATDSTVVSIN